MNNINLVNGLEGTLFKGVMDLITKRISTFYLCKLTSGKNSPIAFPIPEIENGFIVYYPPNSDHYIDSWDGESKKCRILKGTIYEAKEEKVYSEGDEFEIEKGKVYDPYTLGDMCLALVIKE
jgi:hypothetical protein